MKTVVVFVGGVVGATLVLPVMLLAALLGAPSALAQPSPEMGASGLGQFQGGSAGPLSHGLADIPEKMLVLYVRAAPQCPGLSWSVLAAIGKVETDHGRGGQLSPAGAEGPMQFMPATWAAYGMDGDGDGVASIWDAADAVPSAARYLCANGAGDLRRLPAAIFQYNHDDGYVRSVLALADRYAAAAGERVVPSAPA